MIIYKITNTINNKVYIGQTIHTLSHRRNRHIQCARNKVDRHLYNAMNLYGVENFKFEILDRADTIQELNQLETYYITLYDSVNNGYNMGYGGDNNVMFESSTYEKHSSIMKSPEVRKKISNSMKKYRSSHPFSNETRKKISEALKGNHNFGNSDTRSIGCYCIIGDNKFEFHSYKEAGFWWYSNYKPFGDSYSESTYRRKIIDCINKGYCVYNNHKINITITSDDIKWFKL